MIAGLGGARDTLLAVGIVAAMATSRRDDDRRLVTLAENFRRHVDLADVDQAPRPQLEFQKAFPVSAQRDVVVDTGGHIAEMGRRHVLVHHRLEIEDVERLLRARDQMVVVARRPDERIGRPLRHFFRQRRKGGAGEQRACGHELDEAAAARDLGGGQRHHGYSSLLRILFCRILSSTSTVANWTANLPSFAATDT